MKAKEKRKGFFFSLPMLLSIEELTANGEWRMEKRKKDDGEEDELTTKVFRLFSQVPLEVKYIEKLNVKRTNGRRKRTDRPLEGIRID